MKNKNLIYCNFIIATLVVITVFVTARSYIQLALATALYFPLIYFAFKLLPPKKPVIRFKKPRVIKKVVPQVQIDNKPLDLGIVDVDKRSFLKIIGITGVSFFLFSVLTKRVESLLFERLAGMGVADPNIADKKTDSAEPQTTDDYQIAEIDNGEISFYGFTDKAGNWFIMKEDSASGSFRYVRGKTSFAKNWSRRDKLKYDYFHNVFP